VTAASRQTKLPVRNHHAFGVKLPAIISGGDSYDYELPPDIFDQKTHRVVEDSEGPEDPYDDEQDEEAEDADTGEEGDNGEEGDDGDDGDDVVQEPADDDTVDQDFDGTDT